MSGHRLSIQMTCGMRTAGRCSRFRREVGMSELSGRDAVGGTVEDLVTFKGSGVTAAVNKGDRHPGASAARPSARRNQQLDAIPQAEPPVVFVDPYEHPSKRVALP
jgi:hypothetical protein